MRSTFSLPLILPLLLLTQTLHAADGGTLKLDLPEGSRVSSALAVASGIKVETKGAVEGKTVTFEKILPETPYDVRLTLDDGTTIQGVNLDWYNEEEAKPDAGPVTDEDRDEIQKISSVDPFYNKHEILEVSGAHDRAAVLVQLIRDKDFYAGKGEVIWHIEIYYFKNQHGGWEKISQQNKVIRRERFKTHDQSKSTLDKARFLSSLGGLKLARDETSKTVKIQSLDAKK